MAQNFIQCGDTLEYANSSGSTITAGSVVVIGSLAGVALNDIPDGESGTVMVEGVFKLTKVTGTAFSQGDELFWDSGNTRLNKTATDKPIGTAHEAAGSSDTTAMVKLYGRGNGTATAAVVTFSAGSNLSGVDGTGSNAAPLAGTETRLDALDTAVAAILTSLKNAGLMASS
jgi:predicted RecA/RadA family phage recombinase